MIRTRQDLRAALAALDMTQGECAATVNRYAGTSYTAQSIWRMCADSPAARDPSPPVRAVMSMLMERRDETALVRAVRRAGWRPEGEG